MKGTRVEGAGYIPQNMRWDTKFEKFLKKLNKKGMTYAEWQKEKYRTTVSHKNGKVNGL